MVNSAHRLSFDEQLPSPDAGALQASCERPVLKPWQELGLPAVRGAEPPPLQTKRTGQGAAGKTKPGSQPNLISFKLDDRYEILKRVGSGGHSIVYEARDLTENGCRVAIKAQRRGLTWEAAQTDSIGDGDLRQELVTYKTLYGDDKQAACAAGILNVQDVLGAFQFEGKLHQYLSMELCERTVFDQFLNNPPKTCSATLFKKVANGMLTALQFIHSKGLVHRDVKPSNFCVDIEAADGSAGVRIFDMGLACEMPREVGCNDRFVGTPAYASSRSLHGYQQGPGDDLESLGYTMFEMLIARDLPWMHDINVVLDINKDWNTHFLKKLPEIRETTWKSLVKANCIPLFLLEWRTYVGKLKQTDRPDYTRLRRYIDSCVAGHIRDLPAHEVAFDQEAMEEEHEAYQRARRAKAAKENRGDHAYAVKAAAKQAAVLYATTVPVLHTAVADACVKATTGTLSAAAEESSCSSEPLPTVPLSENEDEDEAMQPEQQEPPTEEVDFYAVVEEHSQEVCMENLFQQQQQITGCEVVKEQEGPREQNTNVQECQEQKEAEAEARHAVCHSKPRQVPRSRRACRLGRHLCAPALQGWALNDQRHLLCIPSLHLASHLHDSNQVATNAAITATKATTSTAADAAAATTSISTVVKAASVDNDTLQMEDHPEVAFPLDAYGDFAMHHNNSVATSAARAAGTKRLRESCSDISGEGWQSLQKASKIEAELPTIVVYMGQEEVAGTGTQEAAPAPTAPLAGHSGGLGFMRLVRKGMADIFGSRYMGALQATQEE